jgi:predicted amidophosphoribosyltransferase
MNECPCCSEQLLRHARHGGVYWFCPHCWEEMPNLDAHVARNRRYTQVLNRPITALVLAAH